jgi:hypothetical protein
LIEIGPEITLGPQKPAIKVVMKSKTGTIMRSRMIVALPAAK